MSIRDEDRSKTLAEYLGFRGTPEEVLIAAEEETEQYPDGSTMQKLKELLEYAGYQLDSKRVDSKGSLYPYVIRALMYGTEKDRDDRLIPPKESTPARTVGELITDMGAIDDLLTEQEKQIADDYSEKAKRDKILSHRPKRSDIKNDTEFFFRFWRSPIKKMFDYLALGTSPDSMRKKREILTSLSKSPVSDVDTFSQYTPEYLVEEKVTDENKREEEIRKAKDEPLFKLFNIKFGTNFPIDPTFFPDVDKGIVNGYFRSEDQLKECKEYLRKLLGLDLNNIPDTYTFTELSFKSENDIVQNKETYRAEAIKRLDENWIKANMTRTFGDFLKERRKDNAILTIDPTLGPTGTVATVLNILKTEPATGETPQPDVNPKELHMGLGFGKGLMEILSEMALNDIKNQREEIRKEYTDSKFRKGIKYLGGLFMVKDTDRPKTRKLKRTLQVLTTVTALLAGSFGISHLFSNGEKQADKSSDKAPTEERAQAAKPKTQAPAPAVSKQAQAPAVAPVTASTNMVQKALDQQAATNALAAATTTNNVNVAQKPAKPTEIISKKGNHLIGLHWTGYKDIDHQRVMEEAPDLVFKTHFDYMNKRIQETGLPFVDLFKPEFTRRTLKAVHDYVWLKPVGSKNKIKFYIRPNGRERDEITEDLLSFYMNCRDVLQSLPVASTNLPAAQSKVMTAMGYAMGYSTKQQIAWQRLHPEEAAQATAGIAELARAAIKEHKTDTNNVEAVFMETVEAARVYRETHPGNRALLLSVDEVARGIANIGKEDMAQYDKLAPKEQTEAHKHIEELHKSEGIHYASQRPRNDTTTQRAPSRENSSSESSSSGWGTKTLLIGMGLAYLWGRKKRRGG